MGVAVSQRRFQPDSLRGFEQSAFDSFLNGTTDSTFAALIIAMTRIDS